MLVYKLNNHKELARKFLLKCGFYENTNHIGSQAVAVEFDSKQFFFFDLFFGTEFEDYDTPIRIGVYNVIRPDKYGGEFPTSYESFVASLTYYKLCFTC